MRVFGPAKAADWGLDVGMREGRLRVSARRTEITVSVGADLDKGARVASQQTALSQIEQSDPVVPENGDLVPIDSDVPGAYCRDRLPRVGRE